MTIRKISIWACSICLAASAWAKTCTWTGAGGDMKWSTPQNWGEQSAAAVPASGDVVVVSVGSAAANTNDIVGLTLKELTFTGSSSVATTFTGEKIAIAENGAATVTLSKSASALRTPFDLPETAKLSIANSAAITVGGALSGNGVCEKTGAGAIQIDANNSAFSGRWDFKNGQVKVYNNANAFGPSTVNVYGKVNASGSGSTLFFLRPITVAGDFHLHNDTELRSQRGVTLTGRVIVKTTNSSEVCLFVAESSGEYHGYIVFEGEVCVDAEEHAGKLNINLSNANHYVRFGGTSLTLQDRRLGFGDSTEGTVYLDCPISSSCADNDFLQIDNGVKVVMGCKNALPETTKITFGKATVASGLRGGLDLNGYDQRVAMIYASSSTSTATNRQYLTSLGGPACLTVLEGKTTSNSNYNDFLEGEASIEFYSSVTFSPKFYGENTSTGSFIFHGSMKPYFYGKFPNISSLGLPEGNKLYLQGAEINERVEIVFNGLSSGNGLVSYAGASGTTAKAITVARVLGDGIDIPAGSYQKSAKSPWIQAGTCVIPDHVYRWVWTGAGGDGRISTAANWATNVAPGDAAAPVILDFGGALPSQVITVPAPLTIAGMTSGANTSPVCLKGPGALTVSGSESNALVATFKDGLSIVHSGTGTQTFSCPLASVLRSLSVDAGRVAFMDGSVVENLGMVSLATGARIELGENVIPVCTGLSLAGVAQPAGKYGSSSSQARYKMDDFFAGTGYLWYKGGVIIVVR